MPDGATGVAGETGQPGRPGRGRRFHAPGRAYSGRGFLGRRALVAMAVAVPMAEAVAANATAPAARVLSPEVTALGPLAVFHDLRWAAWLLAEFLVLSAAALVINRLPAGWAIPVAGLTGVAARLPAALAHDGGRGAARRPARRPGCAGHGARDFLAGHPVDPESPLQEAAEVVAQAATAWRMLLLAKPSTPWCPSQ